MGKQRFTCTQHIPGLYNFGRGIILGDQVCLRAAEDARSSAIQPFVADTSGRSNIARSGMRSTLFAATQKSWSRDTGFAYTVAKQRHDPNWKDRARKCSGPSPERFRCSIPKRMRASRQPLSRPKLNKLTIRLAAIQLRKQ